MQQHCRSPPCRWPPISCSTTSALSRGALWNPHSSTGRLHRGSGFYGSRCQQCGVDLAATQYGRDEGTGLAYALPMLMLQAIYEGYTGNLKLWLSICPRKWFTIRDTHDGIGTLTSISSTVPTIRPWETMTTCISWRGRCSFSVPVYPQSMMSSS